jgi:uncharacterized protein (UPF0210 family)
MSGSNTIHIVKDRKVLQPIRIVSSKTKRREQLANISNTNTEVVTDLVSEAKALNAKKQYKDAARLLDVAEKILENNKKFQNMVGSFLSNSD